MQGVGRSAAAVQAPPDFFRFVEIQFIFSVYDRCTIKEKKGSDRMFRILVVEDDKNARRLMEAVLTRYGYEPICAKDGVEALEILDLQFIGLQVEGVDDVVLSLALGAGESPGLFVNFDVCIFVKKISGYYSFVIVKNHISTLLFAQTLT